jgi:hypothetical protein
VRVSSLELLELLPSDDLHAANGPSVAGFRHPHFFEGANPSELSHVKPTSKRSRRRPSGSGETGDASSSVSAAPAEGVDDDDQHQRHPHPHPHQHEHPHYDPKDDGKRSQPYLAMALNQGGDGASRRPVPEWTADASPHATKGVEDEDTQMPLPKRRKK